MMLRYPLRLIICLCCIAVAPAMLRFSECRAQFAPLDEPAACPAEISRLGPLLASINNVIYGYSSGMNQYWDAKSSHYRGRMLDYLFYPQLPRAGYMSFSLIQMERNHIQIEEDLSAMQTTIERTEHQASMDNHRVAISYHYDTAGWLRAIITKAIAPEYEAFTENSDSFFYSFGKDGSCQIRWKQDELSTGTGYSARSECPPLAAFHTMSKHVITRISLDAFQNISSIDTRTDELWDTCTAGGTKYWRRSLSYDGEGKLICTSDSSSPYQVATLSQSFSYDHLSAEAFAAAVKERPSFKAIQEPAVKNWLAGEEPLSGMVMRSVTTNLLRYDYKQQKHVLRPDSPEVRRDTSFFIVDASRNRIAYVPPGTRPPLNFYIRAAEPRSGDSIIQVQSLPAPPEAGSAIVCQPLALSTSYTHKKSRRALGSDTLRLYYTSETLTNYGGYSAGGAGQIFSPKIAHNVSYRIKTMSLTDNRGLVKYLWLEGIAYKLSYH